MNSMQARPNPFTDLPDYPAPACSQVKIEEDVQTYTCTSGGGSSGSVDQHYEEFQIKTIKVEEDEDEDYLTADMDDTLKVFPCSSCSLSYTLQIDLNKHIRRCHFDVNENLLTPGEIKNELLLHSKQTSSHNKPSHKELKRETHRCSQCGKSFTQQSHLKVHQRIHTGERPYRCSQCGRSFSQQSHLTLHQRTHTGENPYHCIKCDKTFSQLCGLKRHWSTHTGERPYPCSQCGRCFTRQSHLKQHLRIHTGEKPYHCSQCGKSFSHLNSLKQHMRIHTGEKPYQCSQCGKSFTHLKSLKQHLCIHTGVKSCPCSDCGKNSSSV